MPRTNLRALFTAGIGPDLTAQDVFTDRISELEAFERSLDRVLTVSSAQGVSPVVDVSQPRRNVLVYYGIGGIGKTRLSEVLESRFTDWKLGGLAPERVAVRVDFAEAHSFDLESLLLRIRAGLGELSSHWTAFDLAFGLYWQRAHPGEPLRSFLQRGSVLRRMALKVGLEAQMARTIADFVTEIGNAAQMPAGFVAQGGRLAHLLYERITAAIAQRNLLRECPFFEPLVNADADQDCLSYLSSLLAWELGRLSDGLRAVVIFLDTVEAVLNGPSREFERLLQRVVFLMPNVLFVITGRQRLDWAELQASDEIDYVGTACWPLLHGDNRLEEPRQHLVGYLTRSDCEQYLTMAITLRGRPALDSTIRSRIIEGSGGLPLYLDLSVGHYLAMVARDHEPVPEDFGGPFPAVVARLMRDLDADERSLLRGFSLVRAFDAGMARAMGGDIPDAVIARTMRRPFVEFDPSRAWPYALHENLREAIRNVDSQLRDGWSLREWRAAARRVLDHLSDVARQSRAVSDRERLAAALSQGLALLGTDDDLPVWLVEVASHLAEIGLWGVLDRGAAAVVSPASPIEAFRLGLRGVRLHRQGTLEASLDALSAALDGGHFMGEAADFLALNRADTLRAMGRYDDAARQYTALAKSRSATYASRARYWLADIAYLKGRFTQALRVLESSWDDDYLHGESLRLRGHIYRVNALFDTAEVSYHEALDLARRIGAPAIEGEALTNLAEVSSWLRPEVAVEWGRQAIAANEAIENKIELVKAHVALAVAAHGEDARDTAQRELEISRALAREIGFQGGLVFGMVAEAFQSLISDPRASVDHLYHEIDVLTNHIGGNRFWLDVLDVWRGEVSERSRARWLRGLREARKRWAIVLTRRRQG